MPSDPDLDTLLLKHDQLKSELAAIADVRLGSLVPVMPAGNAVERTHAQLRRVHRFRHLVQDLIAVSETGRR